MNEIQRYNEIMDRIVMDNSFGLNFHIEKKDEHATVYWAVLNGHLVEVLVVKYHGTDYSMYVDNKCVFAGWREQYAKPEVLKTIKSILENK